MRNILTVTKDTVTGMQKTDIQQFVNDADAIRSWGNAIREMSKNPNNKMPLEDLQLYAIGYFDTETFEIVPRNDFLANANEFIGK